MILCIWNDGQNKTFEFSLLIMMKYMLNAMNYQVDFNAIKDAVMVYLNSDLTL